MALRKDVQAAKQVAAILRGDTFPPPKKLPSEPEHGTYDMSARYGCGCKKCLEYTRKNQRPKTRRR